MNASLLDLYAREENPWMLRFSFSRRARVRSIILLPGFHSLWLFQEKVQIILDFTVLWRYVYKFYLLEVVRNVSLNVHEILVPVTLIYKNSSYLTLATSNLPGDLPLGCDCLAEFNYLSTSLY